MDLPANLLPAGSPRDRAHAPFLDRHERWTVPPREYFEGLELGLGPSDADAARRELRLRRERERPGRNVYVAASEGVGPSAGPDR